MISTLFSKFRHQYANGGLTTELLMTHAEQYLVKATVTIGDQVVATALAADPSLTVADDQAKIRVLALLGFGQDLSQENANETQNIGGSQSTHTSVAISQTDPEPASSPVFEEPPLPPAEPVPGVEESDDIGRPLDSITPDEAPAPAEVPASSIAANAIENFDDTNPVDLSDVIAQTDVEMARLGWSSLQGRTYLEQTFNKRSRQQLTDEELLTFLLYLESQATPSMQ